MSADRIDPAAEKRAPEPAAPGRTAFIVWGAALALLLLIAAVVHPAIASLAPVPLIALAILIARRYARIVAQLRGWLALLVGTAIMLPALQAQQSAVGDLGGLAIVLLLSFMSFLLAAASAMLAWRGPRTIGVAAALVIALQWATAWQLNHEPDNFLAFFRGEQAPMSWYSVLAWSAFWFWGSSLIGYPKQAFRALSDEFANDNDNGNGNGNGNGNAQG